MAVGMIHAFYLKYLGYKVENARILARIPFPIMYASEQDTRLDKSKFYFNCAQRVYHDSLENFPFIATLLFIGGQGIPSLAGFGGVLYLVSKVQYNKKYFGNAKWLKIGILGDFATLMMVYASLVAIGNSKIQFSK
jgi:glutathione S-transferase